tara:strand:- start:805 stop:1215 length:411 start_codon:yes stop_codon:yes gene_type:complete
MSYDFKAEAAALHDGDWCYEEKEKCGYTSARGFDYSVYCLSHMTPSDETITDKWKTDCCGYNDDWLIDWQGDSLEGYMKEVAKTNGEVTFFRRDSMNHGTVCVDYNIREIYISASSSYNSVDFIVVFPNGTMFVEA